MIADDTLFPYQRRNVNEMVRMMLTKKAIIGGSDTGTGKTYEICTLAAELNMKIFGVVPKAVIETWFNVAEVCGAEILGLTNYESAKNGRYYRLAGEYFAEEKSECEYLTRDIIDGDLIFRWNLPQNTLLVFDEAHRGKNSRTQTSKLMEFAKCVVDGGNNCKIVILSATITDTIECFRTPAYLLDLAQKGRHAYKAWLKTLGGGNIPIAEKLHNVIYVNPATKCGTRTRISDLQQSQDEIIRQLFRHNDIRAQTYDMTPEVEAEIEAAHATIQQALTDLKLKQQGESCPLTIILRARQRIEMLKVPTLVMQTMEYIDQGKSVVIFVNFDETSTRLFEQLDPFIQDEHRSFLTFINGSQSPTERSYNIKAFQADRSRIMVANIRAGGVGVSLHDLNGTYPRVSLICPTWSSIELKQAAGRIHRAGARSDAIQRIVYCKGKVSAVGPDNDNLNDTTFMSKDGNFRIGVEELMAENINRKLHTLEWLNNGDEDDLVLM